MTKPNIVFLPIKTNQQKISSICEIIQKHFDQKEPILIIVPTEQALNYLDNLLWKFPEDSFLPHTKSNVPCQEKIVITTLYQNLNQAKILVHLGSEICPIVQQFESVYELFDETAPEKKEQSQKRQKDYAQAGFKTAMATSMLLPQS